MFIAIHSKIEKYITNLIISLYKITNLAEYDMMHKEKEHNIKLQSIPAFFADARADAHEKMRVRLQFFFVMHHWLQF